MLKHKHDWPSPGERMNWTGRERENRQRSPMTPGEQGVGRAAIQRWPGNRLQGRKEEFT